MKSNADKILVSIELLTGMKPVVIDTQDKYILSLGIMNPLEVGYNKHMELASDVMYRSALISMLETICDLMKDEGKFNIWLEETSSRTRFPLIQSN